MPTLDILRTAGRLRGLLLLASAAVLAVPALAQTITVTNSAQLSAALATAPPGAIVDVQPGTYIGPFFLTSTADFLVIASGGLGSAFLRGPGAGSSFPVLTIATPHTNAMQFDSLVFRTNDNVGGLGGGIYIEDSSPTFKNCRVSFCRASAGGLGGGVYITGDSEPLFQRCFVRDCTATLGGGVFVENMSDPLEVPRPRFVLTRVEDNFASTGGGGLGVRGFARAHLVDSWVLENMSDQDGGGLWSHFGSVLEVDGCVVAFNSAVQFGGGIFFRLYEGGLVQNSTIYLNTCTDPGSLAGGIYIANTGGNPEGGNGTFEGGYGPGTPGNGGFDELDVNDCLIQENDADEGGGVYAENAVPELRFLTLNINDARAGTTGGLLVSNSTAPSVPLMDSILWENTALLASTPWGDEFLDIGSTPSSPSFNDIQGSMSPSWSPPYSTAGRVDANPLWILGYTTTLAPVDGYFLTQTPPASPCLDAGSMPALTFGFLAGRSTNPSGATDAGQADMGYHYP